MSLYADYLKETGQRKILETEQGFATYQIDGVECYIVDIYVAPEARKLGYASTLADKVALVAKDYGCRILTGSVNLQMNTPAASRAVLEAYGFKLFRSEPDMLWFYKEL